jgi:hypothetical protein
MKENHRLKEEARIKTAHKILEKNNIFVADSEDDAEKELFNRGYKGIPCNGGREVGYIRGGPALRFEDVLLMEKIVIRKKMKFNDYRDVEDELFKRGYYKKYGGPNNHFNGYARKDENVEGPYSLDYVMKKENIILHNPPGWVSYISEEHNNE